MKKLGLTLILFALYACSNNVVSTSTTISSWNFDTTLTKPDVSVSDASKPDMKFDDTDSVQDQDVSIEEIVGQDENDSITEEIVEEVTVICLDDDGDGYGINCELGKDCDDLNPNFGIICPDCSSGNVSGCSCKGKSTPCYSDNLESIGKGICKAGTQVCKNGFWGACLGEVNPAIEVCNNKDDDCDGQTDEGVTSSCNNCDMSCVQQGVGISTGNPISLNSENSSGVGIDPTTGMVKIDSSQISLKLKFLWASNSSENTVSKIDCKNIKEVGRYQVCNNPSRTSVDLDGNVFASCRGDGKVAKIIAEKKNCIDKNGNSVIETSSDLNGDGSIQGNEMVANDECILFIVQPLGQQSSYPGSRGAAVDKFNNVYIGYWNEAKVAYLDGKTGATIKTIDWQCPTYGLVVDQKGYLWGQGNGCDALMMYSPTDNKWLKASSYSQNGISAYGINVDGAGRIWVGGSLARYNPADGTWMKCNVGCAGIATTNDGMVFLAKDGGGIGKVNGENCQDLGSVNSGGSPHGVAVDFDGFVWGVNLGGNSVDKIDPGKNSQQIGPQVGSRGIGSGPYTYSDMTGYTLNYFTAPKGLYIITFFAGGGNNPISVIKSKATWLTLMIEGQFPVATFVNVQIKSGNTQGEIDVAQLIDLGKVDANTPMPIDLTILSKPMNGIMLQVQVNLVTEDKKVSPMLGGISAKAKLM